MCHASRTMSFEGILDIHMSSYAQRLAAADAVLRPCAVRHASAVRRYAEAEDDTRFPYQRDRDRVLHTQAFRRLASKTQVFVAGYGDHYRTRITHTLEVAQISRDIARTLGLNEDLAESIALAHDLGHTPFGHAGEQALDRCLVPHGLRFEHNEQSLRLVEELETRSTRYPGLNLTLAVLDGMRKHRRDSDADPPLSLEAQVVNLSDEIAYTAHDADDGLRAGLIDVSILGSTDLGKRAIRHVGGEGTEVRAEIVRILVHSLCVETENNLDAGTMLVAFEPTIATELSALRALLWERVYKSGAVLTQAALGQRVLRDLFERFVASPPEKVQARVTAGVPLFAAIRDYIAGMTDGFALREWGKGKE